MKSKINKFFAWLVVFLLVIGLAGFGLQDVISRWGTSRIATVGDIEISTKEFTQSFIQELNYMSQILGQPITIEEAKSMGTHQRVIERLLNKSLLDQLLNDMQLSTGDKTLIKNLKGDPQFLDSSGEFNRKNYQLYLDRLSLSENEFEEILRADMTRNLILQMISGKFTFNPHNTKFIANYVGEERVISISKANKGIVNVVKNQNLKDLNNFFIKNKENYRTNKIKKISFLWIDYSKLADQIKISDEILLETYNSRKDKYKIPERRKLNRIVFKNKESAETVYKQISSGNKTFEQIAQTRQLSSKELNYGTFAKNDLSMNLQKIIFSLDNSIGSVIRPIEGELGYEIFQITEILPAENLNFEKVKSSLENEVSIVKAKEKVSIIAPEIEDMIAAGESLEKISKEFSLQIENLDWVESNNLPKTFNDLQFKNLLKTISSETSDLIELDSGVLVSIRLDEEIAPEIPLLEDVLDQVTNDLYKKDFFAALNTKVTDILSNFDKTDTLAPQSFTYLFDEKIKRQTSLPYLDPDVITEIFKAKTGDLIIKTLDNGSVPYLIIIKIKKILHSENNDEEYEKIRSAIQNQMNEQINNDLIISLINSLRELYKPTVNLKRIDQIISSLQ